MKNATKQLKLKKVEYLRASCVEYFSKVFKDEGKRLIFHELCNVYKSRTQGHSHYPLRRT